MTSSQRLVLATALALALPGLALIALAVTKDWSLFYPFGVVLVGVGIVFAGYAAKGDLDSPLVAPGPADAARELKSIRVLLQLGLFIVGIAILSGVIVVIR